MRIGEVADKTGVGTRMLRYYEDQGLLEPQRSGNGYRRYTEADVERVKTIQELSSAGVPTRFIKIVLDREYNAIDWTDRCDEILAGIVQEQITDLDSKIRCLTRSRNSLHRLLEETQG